jgi:hypothetical protein
MGPTQFRWRPDVPETCHRTRFFSAPRRLVEAVCGWRIARGE